MNSPLFQSPAACQSTRMQYLGRALRFFIPLLALTVLPACKQSHYEGATYAGHSFNEWYLRWAKATDAAGDKAAEEEARDAIKHIGTNALPFLLSELRAQAEHEKAPQIPPNVIFRILGPTAAPAIPDLEAMTLETNKTLVAKAAYCLAAIGDEAVPAITRLLAAPGAQTRYAAAHEFGGQLLIGASGSLTRGNHLTQTIPALAQCTRDPDPYVAIAAIRALSCLNMDSGTTVPALQNAVNSTNSLVREEAAAALAKMGH